MKVFIIENTNGTLWVCLNVLRWVGFLVPGDLTAIKKLLMPIYSFFWFMFIVGIYVIVQTGDLIEVWGDVSLMTGSSFLLFTSLAFTIKIINVMLRKDAVQAIIDKGDNVLRSEDREQGKAIVKSSNQETGRLIRMYAFIIAVTEAGWAASAEKGKLPLRAWYPYDTSKSPAYELTYIHQIMAVVMLGLVNGSLDVLVTSLTAVCRCRLQLLALSLRTLGHDLLITNKHLLTPEQEAIASERLKSCVIEHQNILESAAQIQACFTEPILAQLTVSVVIICVTAYQIAVESHTSTVRLASMMTYLMGITAQVFLYCYEGSHLTVETADIADAAYASPWYAYSTPLRRTLLVMMARSRRAAILTAGGLTTLSLDCFVSVIKISYSFFTVLQQIEE